MPTVFGNQQTQYVDVIKQMLMASLADQSSYEVRFCAVKATVNYLLVHEKDTTIMNHFKDLLTPILTVRNLLPLTFYVKTILCEFFY